MLSSSLLQTRAGEVFTKDTLYSTLPILTWAPKYGREDLLGDAIAGLTVGLTVIPQAIAYATLAGLPANVSTYLPTYLSGGRQGLSPMWVLPA